jgi:hypothetical protein
MDFKLPPSGMASELGTLGREGFVQIARALGQNRPLARGFSAILNALLGSLQEGTPTIRAKVLRAVRFLIIL